MNKLFCSTICFTAAALFFTNSVFAQSAKPAIKPSSAQSIHVKVYEQAKALADFPTAIQAAHYVLAEAPERNASWKDSLALLYYQSGAYLQCYTLTNQLLQSGQLTELRLEMQGACAKQLGQALEGINAYSRLFEKTKNAYYGFEQLQLEYSIRRLAEAVVTGNKVLNAIDAKDSTQISVLRKDGKTPQQVSVKAATHYTLALSYSDLKQDENAAAAAAAALADAPAFELAADLLAKLKNPSTASNK